MSQLGVAQLDKVLILYGDGPPEDGVRESISIRKGTLHIDLVTPALSQNTGTAESPVWSPVGGGGASILHQATVTLDNDQIKALPTTMIEIVPALGESKMHVFSLGLISPRTPYTPYTNITGDAGTGFVFYDPVTGNDWSIYADGTVAGNLAILTWDGTGRPPIPVLHPQSAIDDGYMVAIGPGDPNNSFHLKAFNFPDGDFTGGDPANQWDVTIVYYTYDLDAGAFV